MNDTDAIEMMKRCSAEIKTLRKRIDVLAPKADAYDNLCIVLGLLPKERGVPGEDLAWKLDHEIKTMEQALADTAEGGA